MVKHELFKKFQKPILAFANSWIGRRYLGLSKELDKNIRIFRMHPNSYVVRRNGHFEQVFRGYDLFGQRLESALRIASFGLVPIFFKGAPALMFALTVNTFFSGAGDGFTKHDNASWDTAHDATSANFSDYTSELIDVKSEYTDKYWVNRGFFPVDTSVLPDDAIVLGATFQVFFSSVRDDDNDGNDYLNIVQTSQASPLSIVNGDHDQCGAVNSPTVGSTNVDISGLSAGGSHTFTLNATGLGWISRTGYTMLGMREGHDIADNSVATSTNTITGVRIFSSERAGTAQDPTFVVTFDTPPGAFPYTMW